VRIAGRGNLLLALCLINEIRSVSSVRGIGHVICRVSSLTFRLLSPLRGFVVHCLKVSALQ